jgi:tetratricopeptide (TPR) repeat protein
MITQPSTPAITPAILSTSENVALLEKLQIDSSINFADQNFARAMGYYKNGQIGDAFSAIEKPMKLLKDSSTVPLDEDLANKHDLFATICSVLGKHELAIESFATLQGYYEGLGEQGKMNLARAFRGLGIAYDETGKPQMAEQMLGNALHIPLFTLQFDR